MAAKSLRIISSFCIIVCLGCCLQLAEEFFLLFCQLGRKSYLISYNQIAETAFLFVDRKAFSFQTGLVAVLCTRTYFQFYLTVQGIDGGFSTQYSGVQVNVYIGIQVIVFPLELRVVGNDKGNVQVTVRSSFGTFTAMAGQFDDLSVGNTGRDCYPEILTIMLKVCLWVVAASRKVRGSSA